MYKWLVTIFISTLVSCGPKKLSANYQNNIVLGAFYDILTDPTLDLTQLKDLTRVVDLKSDMSPVKNQSDRGTCSLFSTMALLESAIKKDLKKEVNLSEEYLNYSAKNNGYFSDTEGSTVTSNFSAINQDGIMLERDWSYQPSWFAKGLPCEKYKSSESKTPAFCFSHAVPDQDLSAKIIRANDLVLGSIPKNTNEIIKFMAKYKRPLIASVTVNFNGWPDSGDVYYDEKLRDECLSDDSNCGNHSILLTGYDINNKVFFFKNSWGKEWGQEGFGTITFDTIDRYANFELFYARAKETLAIPADYDKDYLSIENFEPGVTLKNMKIDITVGGKVNAAKGRFIYLSSYIGQKEKTNLDAATDDNTAILNLSTTESEALGGETGVRAFKFYQITKGDYLDLAKVDSLHIFKETLGLDSVKNLFSSKTHDPFMRTTVYVYTDDLGYRVLNRVYQPLLL